MKTCKDCEKRLQITDFHKKHSNKDGYAVRCKRCHGIKYTKADPRRVFAKIYGSQIDHSVTRGHVAPDYTLDQLKDWVDRQPNAHQLWNGYVTSGYDRWARPSVDRVDNSKPYTLDNIRLMTWKENHQNGADSKASGDLNAGQVPVAAYTKDGKLHRKYHSISEALRDVGGVQWGIYTVANGKKVKDGKGYYYMPQSYKGFVWRWI